MAANPHGSQRHRPLPRGSPRLPAHDRRRTHRRRRRRALPALSAGAYGARRPRLYSSHRLYRCASNTGCITRASLHGASDGTLESRGSRGQDSVHAPPPWELRNVQAAATEGLFMAAAGRGPIQPRQEQFVLPRARYSAAALCDVHPGARSPARRNILRPRASGRLTCGAPVSCSGMRPGRLRSCALLLRFPRRLAG